MIGAERRVAVVIPLYNHERYVGPALESLYAQSRPVDRIIIIDDGSRDGSVAAARAKADSRVELITQDNSGAHATLNRAIAMAADCDYIGILNSDDLYHRERIERCLEFLECHHQYDVLCTRLRMINAEGELLPTGGSTTRWMEFIWSTDLNNPIERLGISNFTKTTSNLFGRAAYLRAHPFRPYRYSHDYYFAVVCALEHRLGVLDQELLFYRVHANNTIKGAGADKVTAEVARMHIDLLRAFAPRTADSPQLRSDLADYFRILLGNHADFRTEVFLHLLAQLAGRLPDNEHQQILSDLNKVDFPELIASSSRLLREKLAAESYHQLQRRVATSRWMALGRILGFDQGIADNTQQSPASQLAGLRRHLQESKWSRLGRRFGFGPDPEST